MHNTEEVTPCTRFNQCKEMVQQSKEKKLALTRNITMVTAHNDRHDVVSSQSLSWISFSDIPHSHIQYVTPGDHWK